MQSPAYVQRRVQSPRLRVLVEGVERPVESVDFGSDSTGGVPDRLVSAGTGILSRTGTITWGREPGTTASGSWSPFARQVDGWPPAEGDKVVIEATDGTNTWRRLTGQIGATTGSLADGTLTSEISDSVEPDLRQSITLYPEVGATRTSTSLPSRALASVGVTALPPIGPDTNVWADASDYPRSPGFGRLSDHSAPDGSGSLVPSVSAFGSPVMSGKIELNRTSGSSLIARFRRGSGGAVSMTLRSSAGAETVFSFSISSTGTCTVSKDGTTTGTTTLPIDASDFIFLYVYTGVSNVEVRSADGSTAYLGSVPAGRYVRTIEISRAVVMTYGQLYRSIDEELKVAVPRIIASNSMSLYAPAASRSIEGLQVRTVLDRWCAATLASQWIDEHGRYNLVARDRLVSAPVSRTVNVPSTVIAGSWSYGTEASYRGATVTYETASVRGRADADARIDLPELEPRSYTEATTEDRWLTPDSEDEWGPIGSYTRNLGEIPGADDVMKANVDGLILTMDNAETAIEKKELWGRQSNVTYSASAERIAPRTVKVATSVSKPPTGYTAHRRLMGLNAGDFDWWSRGLYGRVTPIVRTSWVSTWTAGVAIGSTTSDTGTSVYEHDAEWYVTPADAKKIADSLSEELTSTMVTLSDIDVLWDPSRQIGDVETWISADASGREEWRAKVLVVGYSEAWAGTSAPTQSVSVRVIELTDPTSGKRYVDLAGAYARYNDIPSSASYQDVYNALPRGVS